MKATVIKLRSLIQAVASKIDWAAPLLARVCVGVIFAQSGWGKLHSLPDVIEFFQSLGIPAASIQAPFVASLEFVGGCCLILGVLTRIFSVPLIGTMVVAILTAKSEEARKGIGELFGLEEFLMAVLLFWLAIAGAGKASLDYFLAQKVK